MRTRLEIQPISAGVSGGATGAGSLLRSFSQAAWCRRRHCRQAQGGPQVTGRRFPAVASLRGGLFRRRRACASVDLALCQRPSWRFLPRRHDFHWSTVKRRQ